MKELINIAHIHRAYPSDANIIQLSTVVPAAAENDNTHCNLISKKPIN